MPPRKRTEKMFAIVCDAVPPPGIFQTATASARMIATLRRCLLRSGPIRTSTLVRPDVLRLGRGLEGGRRRRQRLGFRHGRARADRVLGRLGGEAVADPEVGVDVAP